VGGSLRPMVVGSLCPMVVGFTRAIVTDSAAARETAVAEPGIRHAPGKAGTGDPNRR